MPNPMTMEALINGQLVEGSPLAWTGSKVYLLTRNGGVAEFSPGSAKDYKKTSDSFSPYPPNMLRGMLQEEFGPQFEVTGTGHFLVVHPKGTKPMGGPFRRHVSVVRDVFQGARISFNRAAVPAGGHCVSDAGTIFAGNAAKNSVNASANMLGYYSHATNRVALFDIGSGRTNNAGWQQNFDTVFHEASHQTAFNTEFIAAGRRHRSG